MSIERGKYLSIDISIDRVPEVRKNIFAMIHEERLRQIGLGYTHENIDSGKWTELLAEEFGEVAKANNDHESAQRVVEELVQLAALAIAWLEVL